jgi:hypothetical protein
MAGLSERDFPPGHPSASDYDPESPEAIEWARKNIHPKGERDFPVDHPKALDTPGNTNAVPIVAGVDPARPQHEAFTGRSPQQAEAVRKVVAELAARAMESPVPEPIEAPLPPKPGTSMQATGQPGVIDRLLHRNR